MVLRIYNTLSGAKEDFVPLHAPEVKMYVCGITPYDETHLGHGRAYVFFDCVRRYLEYSGYKVTYVENITDIDDKIIQKSKLQTSKSQTSPKSQTPNSKTEAEKCREIADKYMVSYFEVMDKLNVKRATLYPKATEHIPEMIKTIEKLAEKGYAYQLDGDVYFDISKFADYGKLSKRKLDDMQAGARVGVDERKRNAYDFALWKAAKEGEPSWESPWGKGRPGWHIECSAMSAKYLGETFDIHGGGLDLVFPHHENEIAQAECATGKPFARYWLHNGFVTVNKEKMSKSLGNFFTLRDIFAKYDPMVVRLFLLSTHYRGPINFSDEQLTASGEALAGIKRAIDDSEFLVSRLGPTTDLSAQITQATLNFEKEMDDDFNTAGALAVVFDMVKLANQNISQNKMDPNLPDKIKTLLKLLGIEITKKDEKLEEEVKKLIKERETAKKNKDFARADAIRVELKAKGIILEDTPFGTRWHKNA